MSLAERQAAFEQIERQRDGRRLISLWTFDRKSEPQVSGLQNTLDADCKEALFRVLKETCKAGAKIDLCIYTRGGDTNAVWPLISVVREFDPDFEVLVPFRCHSAGTLMALGAKRVVLGPISELSPIDPSTGNQFNPKDPDQKNARYGISVEDVRAYREFVLAQLGLDEQEGAWQQTASPFLVKLVELVHPLALGNVHRVHQQIRQLATNLLRLHPGQDEGVDGIVDALTTKFYSHLHMISRHEAKEILGEARVSFASERLAPTLDDLLRSYENDFALRRPFLLSAFLGNDREKEIRFVGGAVESRNWSYLYETVGLWSQQTAFPANIQVQVSPAQQAMPLVPGLPRNYSFEVRSQRWVRNVEPRGITV